MSQAKAILKSLKSGKRLTPLSALKLCGTLNLRARVQELKERGHDIQKRWKKVGGKKVLEYWM